MARDQTQVPRRRPRSVACLTPFPSPTQVAPVQVVVLVVWREEGTGSAQAATVGGLIPGQVTQSEKVWGRDDVAVPQGRASLNS